ncbi:MAG TPA: hypothetical protein PKD85_08695 [Saprospiraceae bacterium]|nr:hypothetical protein [Saprospiraceae bacterium]
MKYTYYDIGLFFLFVVLGCEKSFQPSGIGLNCEYKTKFPDLSSTNDSFYVQGINNGKKWEAERYITNFKIGHEYCDSKSVFMYLYYNEVMDSCDFTYCGFQNGICFENLNDTVFIDKTNLSVVFGHLNFIRAVYKKNKYLESMMVLPEDSSNGENYFVLEEINQDSSIVIGSFQLNLKGIKSPDFVIKNGRFRCKTTK